MNIEHQRQIAMNFWQDKRGKSYQELFGKEKAIILKSKISKSLTGKTKSEEHKQKLRGRTFSKNCRLKMSLSRKGKTLEQICGKEAAEKIKKNLALRFQNKNLVQIYGKEKAKEITEQSRKLMLKHHKFGILGNTEDNIKKGIKTRGNKISTFEIKIIYIIGKYNLNYNFIGDGKLFFKNYNPDFINQKKKTIIEVYLSFDKIRNEGSIKNYQDRRIEAYKGYKVIFIDETSVKNKDWETLCLQKIIEGEK